MPRNTIVVVLCRQGNDADHNTVQEVVNILIGTEGMVEMLESRYARYSGTRGRPADDFCDFLQRNGQLLA